MAPASRSWPAAKGFHAARTPQTAVNTKPFPLEFVASFVACVLVDLVSLNVCQHCSCTSVHILCTPANVVTSALDQVLSKTVIHGIESQHSFNLVAEQWLASNKPMRLLPRCGSFRRFNRALRMSQSSGEGKLNFRHAERHMPGMFHGKATEYTEYIFKMEAYMSTLDPAGKGGEILRAAATEVKDMDDAEVANLAAIFWERVCTRQRVGIHDHRRSWHACSSSVAGIPGIWPPSVAGAEQMVPTKISR